MTYLLQRSSNYRFVQLFRRAFVAKSCPPARWIKTISYAENNTNVDKSTDVTGEKEPIKFTGELRTENALKFQLINQPKFPKSAFKNKDISENLSPYGSDDPDSFGNLSGWNALKTEVYEGNEGDKIEEEFIPHRLSQQKYAQMIKKLLNQRRFADALNVLNVRMLKEDRVKPDYYIYGILINFCGKVGYSKMAFKLFREMLKRNLTITPSIYTSLFNSCANCPFPKDGLTLAKRLQINMMQNQIVPTLITCHAMIKAFGRCGSIRSAFEVGDFMMENKMQLKCETFTFIFQACISEKDSGFRHMLLVYRKMIEYRIKPDLYIFNMLLRCVRDTDIGDFSSMIDVLLKLGVSSDKVKQIQSIGPGNSASDSEALLLPAHPWEEKSDDMLQFVSGSSGKNPGVCLSSSPNNAVLPPITQENNFLPNLLQRNPSLGSLVSLSDVKEPHDRLFLLGGAKGIFAEMNKYNVIPDIKTASLLLDCTPPTCDAEHALIRELKNSYPSLKLGISFFNTLIRRRTSRRQLKEAKAVIELIGKEGAEVDLITFGSLALTCDSSLAACELMKAMDEAGMRPNINIVGAFMRRALHYFNYSYIQLVFEIIAYEEMSVNTRFIKMLDLFYAKSKQCMIEKKPYDKKAVGCMKKFLVHYPIWKKSAKIEEESHPWEQFKQEYVGTEADDDFLSKCVEPEQLQAKFSRKGPTTNIKVRAAKIKKLKQEQPELFMKKKRRVIARTSSEIEGFEIEDLQKMKTDSTS